MIIRVRDVAEAIEAFAPLSLQAEYDNSGLQVGYAEELVRGVLVCLDVSAAVLDEALARDCNMIVSHHPLLFKGIKYFRGTVRESNLVERAIRGNLTLYAAHTNLDFAHGGVSYAMAERLGLGAVSPLYADTAGREMGVIGALPAPMALPAFCQLLKDTFRIPLLRCNAECDVAQVQRVALCGGSGMDLYDAALRQRAEAFATGDVKYHDFQRGLGQMLLADIGHGESERGAVGLLARLIRKKFPTFAVYESTNDAGLVRYH